MSKLLELYVRKEFSEVTPKEQFSALNATYAEIAKKYNLNFNPTPFCQFKWKNPTFEEVKQEINQMEFDIERNQGWVRGYLQALDDFGIFELWQRLELENAEIALCRDWGVGEGKC